MPRTYTKTITLYTFDELSDKAKEKARDWYLESSDDHCFAWEHIQNDASQIGLSIEMLATANNYRAVNEGSFDDDAKSCAELIIENHGDTCETYKTASKFLGERKPIQKQLAVAESTPGDSPDEFDQLTDEINALEKLFLADILEDYRVTLDKEYEYQTSNEVVDETIIANDYTFDENGKRQD